MILPQDLCTCGSFCLDRSPSDIFMALSAYLLQIFTNNVCLVVTSLVYSPHSTHTDSFSLPLDTYYNLINIIPCLVWQCIIYCLTSLCKCHICQRDGTLLPHSPPRLSPQLLQYCLRQSRCSEKVVLLIVSRQTGKLFNIRKNMWNPFIHSLSKQGIGQGERWERGAGWGQHRHARGWFLSMPGKTHHNIIK